MFIKIFMLIAHVSYAQLSAPTDIACMVEGRSSEAVQLFCGDVWVDVNPLPLIEVRFETCRRTLRPGTLIFRTQGSEFKVDDPEFPLNLTLNGIDLYCDEFIY